jgi:hypothetical protein
MLFLSLAAMVAAMALAGSASAQSVEVYDEEPTQNHHCGTVTLVLHAVSGGCLVDAHTTSNAVLEQHITTPVVTEAVVSSCSNEFDARIGENGSGYIYNQVLLPVGPNCNIQPCDEASGVKRPWAFTISEAGPSSAEHETLNVTFCTRLFDQPAGTPGTTCNVNVGLEETAPGSHQYELSANESPCLNLGGIVELSGSWRIEQPVEIFHHDD